MVDSCDVTLLVNPNASRIDSLLVPQIARALEVGGAVAVLPVDEFGSASTAQLDQLRSKNLIVYGGDGTVHHLLRAMASATDTHDPLMIGVLPGGYANVISRHSGAPNDPVVAARSIAESVRAKRFRKVPIAFANDVPFVMCAGMGLDADIMRSVEMQRQAGSGVSAPKYVEFGLRGYLKNLTDSKTFDVTIDEELLAAQRMLAVQQMWPLTYLAGRPLSLVPQSATSGIGFGVWSLRSFNPAVTAVQAARLATASQLNPTFGAAVRSGATQVRIQSTEPLNVQADGEYLGTFTQLSVRSTDRVFHLLAGS